MVVMMGRISVAGTSWRMGVLDSSKEVHSPGGPLPLISIIIQSKRTKYLLLEQSSPLPL